MIPIDVQVPRGRGLLDTQRPGSIQILSLSALTRDKQCVEKYRKLLKGLVCSRSFEEG
jgi:hypothetical protein